MTSLVTAARAGARAIHDAFVAHRIAFQRITQRARRRFETRDWAGGQRDALERLELYRYAVDSVVAVLAAELGEHLQDPAAWRRMKAEYGDMLVDPFPDVELAETFFNSVTRRRFTTVGVDPVIEFVDLDARRGRYGYGAQAHRNFRRREATRDTVAAILSAFAFSVPYRDAEGDAELASELIDSAWREAGHGDPFESIQVLEPVFYRVSGAYLVGRVRRKRALAPLVLVLVHGDEGVELDAVLTTEREVSIVFSYTRSHFLVDVERPSTVTGFLATILPRKPVAELYIGLGYTKHGKTELYRDLMGHLRRSLDRFELARGIAGMVMIVFTLPSYDYVFKVIRDRFAPPKRSSREDVMDRYKLVFRHDRAGRLIEAQEFEHLVFDAQRFDPDVLAELLESAGSTVQLHPDGVHIRHLYIERRVEPLDLYLREADDEAAVAAVLDFGQAIRDLATANIFPGDILLKNFGVTRHGRVTFYDYDELCLVTECTFRSMPKARSHDEEMSAEPWFFVGDGDVFPEEFMNFMGLNKVQREAFVEEHGDVLTAAFWRGLQERHRAGEVLDVFPYPPSKRLSRAT